MKKINFYKILIIFSVFLSGLMLGFFISKTTNDNNKSLVAEMEKQEKHLGGYKYINPLLECNNDESISQEIRPFRQTLSEFLEKEKVRYNINYTSVYFRDLNNGPWIGINEKEKFSPASMLKVPLMMSVLKTIETDPKKLQQQIKVMVKTSDDSQYIKPGEIIQEGKSYSIDELLYRMIVFSDNNAQLELFKYIGDDATAQTYSDLRLEVPDLNVTENFMTVKNYASFFRILFNASYLSRDLSEDALALLTQVEFKDGLVAGVPDKIVVAHKFGERTVGGTGEKQLHDCGIIYYPDHPYLLCIMNRGKDFDEMAAFIKSISGFVYNEINKQYFK